MNCYEPYWCVRGAGYWRDRWWGMGTNAVCCSRSGVLRDVFYQINDGCFLRMHVCVALVDVTNRREFGGEKSALAGVDRLVAWHC